MDDFKIAEVLAKLEGKTIESMCIYPHCILPLSGRYFQFPSGNIYQACKQHAHTWENGTGMIQEISIKQIEEMYK